jgi:2-polyprenyl-6-methoxyphenol hydroxylase-like FAD-dependent oxidoreductase
MCIGDSWNIRHPLTGGGMSVALNDVMILRDVLSHVKNLSDDKVPHFSRISFLCQLEDEFTNLFTAGSRGGLLQVLQKAVPARGHHQHALIRPLHRIRRQRQ